MGHFVFRLPFSALADPLQVDGYGYSQENATCSAELLQMARVLSYDPSLPLSGGHNSDFAGSRVLCDPGKDHLAKAPDD